MPADLWINLLVTTTLIEMMFAVGLGTTLGELLAAIRQWRLTICVTVANYLLVPAVAVALLLAFRAKPMAAAGILILAVCPGAPYGPPFTAIARGSVATSVGWMVMLAATSALIAPLLLSVLLPLTSGDARLDIDALRLAGTLLLSQLAPLCAGLAVRARRPNLAARMLPKANGISKILNVATVGLILGVQYRTLLDIRWTAFAGMFALLVASLAAGWLLGGPSREIRKTLAITTSLRNAAVGMVIASSSFPGTPALTAVLAYALVDVLGSLAIALWWGRRDAMSSRNAAGAALSSAR